MAEQVAERDFQTFNLGDNVYELADGLLLDIAERVDVDLGSEPNSEAMGKLVGVLGKLPTLRDNPDVPAIPRRQAVKFVERSGVQKALSRSLWTPGKHAESSQIDAIVMTGAVANWQDRATRPIISHTNPVYVATGQRIANTATEQTHREVQSLVEKFRPVTESEYAAGVIVPYLVQTNHDVLFKGYPTVQGDELADMFFADNEHLLTQRIAFARVANAGVQLAVQMRKAARKIAPEFDADPENPQVFILTDEFPLARRAAQEKDPANYQKATTALRQAALTAKMLHEAAGGQ